MAQIISITVDDRELRKLIDASKGPVKPKVVADGVEYGIFQEIKYNPFMVPAVEAVRPSFERAFVQAQAISTDACQQVVDKIAFDVEARAKVLAPVDTGALKNSIHVVDGDMFNIDFQAARAVSITEAARRGIEIL